MLLDMSDFDYSDAEDFSYSNDGALDPKRHARTQHNELERRRRNNIKDMYNSLKDSIPGMQNERASRAVILKKAVELITNKKTNLDAGLNEIKELENEYLELQKEWAALESGTDYPHCSSVTTESALVTNANEQPAVSQVVQGKPLTNRERRSAFEDFVPPNKKKVVPDTEYIDIADLS